MARSETPATRAATPAEFSVNTEYSVGEADVPRLNVWQGAALLTADCLGTGLLALPADVKVLGWTLGLGFLLANLPINFYAGTIFHKVASAVESKQGAENIIYQQSVSGGAISPFDMRQVDDDSEDETRNYAQLNQNTASSILSILTEVNSPCQGDNTKYQATSQTPDTPGGSTMVSGESTGSVRKQLHQDTATADFIGQYFPRIGQLYSRHESRCKSCHRRRQYLFVHGRDLGVDRGVPRKPVPNHGAFGKDS
jgi:hypothetical protein